MAYITSIAAGGLGSLYTINSNTNLGLTTTYLLVGGGGGGGGYGNTGSGSGGGGGGGGVLYGTFSLTPSITYTVKIGDGGNGSSSTRAASNGGDTTISSLTALGGGGGGRGNHNLINENGSAGGCGGGGGGSSSTSGAGGTGGAGTVGQGKNGGAGIKGPSGSQGSGGGGGAGVAGQDNTNIASVSGGNGLQIDITGINLYYAGGGAGYGSSSLNRGDGGLGGGAGDAFLVGKDYLGGGGKGGNIAGGDAGCGVAILRSNYLATVTGGQLTAINLAAEAYPPRTFVPHGINATEIIYPFYSNGTINYSNTLASTISNYSCYFSGGDYTATTSTRGGGVGTPFNNSFTVAASGDFTIEFWCCSTVANSIATTLISNRNNATGANGDIEIVTNSSNNKFNFSYLQNNGTVFTTAQIFKPGIWYHVAVARKSSGQGLTLYVNGSATNTSASFTQNTAAVGNASRPIRIGSAPYSNGDAPFTGFISNVRVAKEAIYTGTGQAFTPSISNLTATASTWLLTLQNSTLIDNSTNSWALTAGHPDCVILTKTNPF